ncbi:MAG: cation-translocating P-type ATPase [Polyangiaceae bacterium]|nr:cation-translocating P-type ATPase [Polyangiaceae bacterium]
MATTPSIPSPLPERAGAPISVHARAHSERVSDWIALDPEEVAKRLDTDLGRGLSPSEAERRRARDGANELAEKPPPSALWQLLEQFGDVTVIALIVAALVAVALGWRDKASESFLHRFGDAIAIGIIVVVNAAVGFAQQRKAEQALRALRQLGAPAARVLRAGAMQRVPAHSLVVGDVIEIAEGDRVPADARLFETSDTVVDESALTGESVPVDKLEAGLLAPSTPLAERANMVFYGSHVVRGRARALVVATGMRTELGQIAQLLGSVEAQETPLQRALRIFGTKVVIGSALLGVLVFVVGSLRLDAPIGFLLLTAVSLAVAAIPEGLPAVTTIVLALGVQRMARQNALIRRLSAVETLGAADVICTDKTGTLTENRMVIRRAEVAGRSLEVELGDQGGVVLAELGRGPVTPAFSGDDPLGELVLSCVAAPGARVADDGSIRGDPTDAALLRVWHSHREAAACAGCTLETLRVVPFDRERKLVTVVTSSERGVESHSHGAPEAVLGRSSWVLGEHAEARPLDDETRASLIRRVEEWASLGLRVIAVARARAAAVSLEEATLLERAALLERVEHEMVLVGLLGIADPPRAEVAVALSKARDAGVRTIMITGDHPLTGEAIARELGIMNASEGDVITGPEIDTLDAAELSAKIEGIRVVARATAANKLRLIEALKARGHVVAMTGDGVNDAPAIKAADIGVAMGRGGTDVTREAADMVLLDDNYATIVGAIEQGRIVYGNIKRFIVFLFSVNAGLVLAVLAAAVLGWPPILTPTQILWINLITNGLPALALGMEPVHLDPMKHPPRAKGEGLLSGSELWWLSSYGVLIAVLGVATFASFHGQSLALAQSATFTVLAIGPLFHALNARSRRDSVFVLGFWSNSRLLGAFAVALALQAVALYVPVLGKVFSTTPLPPATLVAVLLACATVWLAGELEKGIRALARRSTQPLHPAGG